MSGRRRRISKQKRIEDGLHQAAAASAVARENKWKEERQRELENKRRESKLEVRDEERMRKLMPHGFAKVDRGY